MKSYFVGFLFGMVFLATGLFSGLWYMNQQPTNFEVDTGESGVNCLGWARSGAMTNIENETFSMLVQHCKNDDIDSYNNLLRVNPEDVELLCTPKSAMFYEPDKPKITLQIRNISNRSIFHLEQHIEEDTDMIGRKNPQKYLYRLTQSGLSNRVKEIKSGETISYDISPRFQSYGEYDLELIYGNWQIIDKSKSMIGRKMVWEQAVTCKVRWE